MSEFTIFVRKLGLVGISNLLIGLGSILLLPILTKNYSVQDYGIWVQVIVTIGLIPYISTLGLSDSMIRFLAALDDKFKIKEEFYSIFFVAIVSSILFGLILLFVSNLTAKYLFDGNIAVALILPLIIFSASLFYLLINYFRTFQQMRIYSLFLILQAYIMIGLVAIFAVFGFSIFTAIVGILISYISISLIMFAKIVRNIGFKFPKFRKINEYLSFGLPNIPSNLSYWVVESSDRILIGILLGTSFVGYYAPSYAIGTIITMFSSPLYVLLFPVLSKYFDRNEITKIKIVLKYTTKYFLAFAIPTAFILSVLSKQILLILTTPEIAYNGYLVIPFVTLSTLIAGLCIILTQVIVLEKKTKIVGSIWISAAILNFLINVIVIPILGIIGAALVTLLSYSLAFILFLLYSRKYLKFDMDLSFIGKSILSSSLISILIYVYYPTNLLNTLICIVLGFIVYLIILLVIRGFKKEEIIFLKDLISS